MNNVKSCGTEFLHQHVASNTAAAAQYVVHEQTEQCQCLAACSSATTAARAAPDPEGPDRDLLRLSNCSVLQSPGDARVFRVHHHTAYAAGQPAVHSAKVGPQLGCPCAPVCSWHTCYAWSRARFTGGSTHIRELRQAASHRKRSRTAGSLLTQIVVKVELQQVSTQESVSHARAAVQGCIHKACSTG